MLDSITVEVSSSTLPPFFACYPSLGEISIAETTTEFTETDRCTSHLTLTCISTDGPATTVLWTRNSTTVAEGNKTVLNDPVTAQYTHTLTMTRSLGGNYTCTVSNDKPSSSSSTFTVNSKYRWKNYYFINH